MHTGDALLLGHIDEGASVDDQHVCFFRLRRHGHPCLLQVPNHDLRINEILRTSEGNEADFGHGAQSLAQMAREERNYSNPGPFART